MVALLALGCAGLAQEGRGGGNGNGAVKASSKREKGYRLPASILVSCPVVRRIKLSDEQIRKVKAAQAKANQGIAEAFKKCEAQGKGRSAYYKQRRKLQDGVRKDLEAALTEEQKKKYDAGRAVVTDYYRKLGKLRGDHGKAMRGAGDDKQKVAQLREKYREQAERLKTERDKDLDSKVGKSVVERKRSKAPKKNAAK
jgi:hypothetical protein